MRLYASLKIAAATRELGLPLYSFSICSFYTTLQASHGHTNGGIAKTTAREAPQVASLLEQ